MIPQNMPPAISPHATTPTSGSPVSTTCAVRPSMIPAMTISDPIKAMPTQVRRVSALTCPGSTFQTLAPGGEYRLEGRVEAFQAFCSIIGSDRGLGDPFHLGRADGLSQIHGLPHAQPGERGDAQRGRVR